MSGETPRQAFRIPLTVIVPAKEKAAAEGVTLTSIVVTALQDYTNQKAAS